MSDSNFSPMCGSFTDFTYFNARTHACTGFFHPTDLGRTASHFYINHESIEHYNEKIKPTMDVGEVIKMISESSEFKQVKVSVVV